MRHKKYILSISGQDPTNGAGNSLDILVANQHNFHCLSSITSLTIQDAEKLHKVEDVNESFFQENLKNLNKNFNLSGIKIGAISSNKVIEITTKFLDQFTKVPIVIDPIIEASGGGKFMKKQNINFSLRNLYPLATLLTPNLDELKILSGCKTEKDSINSLLDRGIENIYVTGKSRKNEIISTLFVNGVKELDVKTKKISKTFHGSGCALSTSILCNLIKTKDLKRSCLNANEFMRKILKNSIKTNNQDFINFS
tara:strand:+ start:171 stop:932 length:762 start_codon:yes stop_codon:yes gene_type:complete